MKKLLFVLLISTSAFAQFRLNDRDYFTASIVIDPSASIKENGLNIGIEIETVGAVYVRASVTYFQALKDGYLDGVVSIGPSFNYGVLEQIRLYSGIRIGVIKRYSPLPTPTYGVEAGIDYNLTETMFVGVRATYDYRSDFEWYDYPNQFRGSGFVRIGFKF